MITTKEKHKETLKELSLTAIAFVSALIIVVLILLLFSYLHEMLCPCINYCTGCFTDPNWYCSSPAFPASLMILLLIAIYYIAGRMKE